jgi:hypothetical protein
MTIKKIIGADGPRDTMLCRGGGCPAAIIIEGDNVVIQGYTLSTADRSQLAYPTGEGFVRMPLAVFEKIARQVLSA